MQPRRNMNLPDFFLSFSCFYYYFILYNFSSIKCKSKKTTKKCRCLVRFELIPSASQLHSELFGNAALVPNGENKQWLIGTSEKIEGNKKLFASGRGQSLGLPTDDSL